MLPTADCATLPDPCCANWWDLSKLILAHIKGLMEECFGDDCTTTPVVFRLAHAAPPIPSGDTFDLWLPSVGVTAGSITPGGMFKPIIGRTMTFGFKLCESGYPTISAGGLPDAAAVDFVTPYLLGRGEALWKAIVAIPSIAGCSGVRITDFRQTVPEAGLAGWQGLFTVSGG